MRNVMKGRRISPLHVIASIIIMLILLPSLMIVIRLFQPVTESWIHIKTYLLKDYLINSITLIFLVGGVTCLLGIFFAWSLSRYKWKYTKTLEILLFLPMAIPPYIGGYVYGGIFTSFGTLHRIMLTLGLKPIKIDILSMGGAVFVFSLFLMPYVMLVTKGFFNRLPKNIEESSRLLGKSRFQTFYKIILPMSRGAIIGGVILVALEVLNDYGLVKYFGIPTFSTAIYTTWFGLSDVDGAIRLASSLMIIVIIILLVEQFFRGRGRLSQAKAVTDLGTKKVAPIGYKILFYIVGTIYLLLSLIIPVAQLIHWSTLAKDTVVLRNLDKILKNTLITAIIVTIVIIMCSIIIGNFNRLHSGIITKIYARIVIVGYSIPASIIAIAVLVFFIAADRSLGGIYGFFGLKNLFLTSSVFMLIFALTIRFMAIGYNSVESGFSKMGLKYYEASKLLGKGEWHTFTKVDLPILKPAIISAMILTFVDVLKELPLTLILRPFNFDTLATKVYTYANDEMIHEGSIYALMIIGVSTLALVFLLGFRKEKAE
ncbi:ABC transporter permease [Vallitalea guaymasensis]|uniref:ABC transporter permease n=1 Tax=Vallitalea guaymasensis TaxID=1185412 RepID=UPI002354B79D|nr:iron ABC transporter permease [Vallitalea guaymasensis]